MSTKGQNSFLSSQNQIHGREHKFDFSKKRFIFYEKIQLRLKESSLAILRDQQMLKVWDWIQKKLFVHYLKRTLTFFYLRKK